MSHPMLIHHRPHFLLRWTDQRQFSGSIHIQSLLGGGGGATKARQTFAIQTTKNSTETMTKSVSKMAMATKLWKGKWKHMKSLTSSRATLTHFIPENPSCKNVLQMFNDEDSAKVVFAVGKQQSKINAENLMCIGTFCTKSTWERFLMTIWGPTPRRLLMLQIDMKLPH